MHTLIDLARHCSRWHDDISFVIVGFSDREEELRRYDNIRIAGGYRPEDAVLALAESGCPVALLLNVFPETFSYTLSESLQAGLVPVAHDFGAIGERMRALGVGVTVPPGATPEQLVAALREAARLRAEVPAERLYGRYGRLMADYYAADLTDLAETVPPPEAPRLLGRPLGLHGDGWCDGGVTMRLWSARPITRLAMDFWVPAEGRLQGVEIACNGGVLARHFIEDGSVRRIVCVLPPEVPRLREITFSFDFVFRLQAPDVRACAAMLSGLWVSEGNGWLALPLAEPPARPAPLRAVA